MKTILNPNSRVERLCSILIGIALFGLIMTFVRRSDTAIVERQSRRVFSAQPLFPPIPWFSTEERRIAAMFVADTLPRLMKMGLITKYERNETNTTVLVAGSIWKARTHFVKDSLLKAVSVYNRVNGFAQPTIILDDHTGVLYAQVLPSDKREIYE